MAGCLGRQVSPSCPTGGGGEDAQAPKGSERAGWDVKTEQTQTQIQIQTQMQILPVTRGQTLGMSLTLMTVLTLTGQVMVFLRMTNVCISSGRRQPGVSGAWYMSSPTSCFSQGTSWMMMQSPSISASQNPSLSLSRSQLQRQPQHRSLAPRGSTDRNTGWCITGRRVSRLSQLNSRSSHARWKARYSPVS